MAIKFLQAEQDIIEFTDYLYDLGYSLARSGGVSKGVILERQIAKDELVSDLICAMNGCCYWIVNTSAQIVLEMISCGGRSHPRCTKRMCRYPGMIVHCYGREKTEAAKTLMNKIRQYFKKKYVFKNCQDQAKENCFWGPHYQKLDEAYIQNPEPTYLCPGYIRLVYKEACADSVIARVKDKLSQYPAIQPGCPVCKLPRDQQFGVEVYVGFLCNRNQFTPEDFETLVNSIEDTPGRAIIRKEKLYIEADTTYRNRKYSNGTWNIVGFVENEWKGFGNFD